MGDTTQDEYIMLQTMYSGKKNARERIKDLENTDIKEPCSIARVILPIKVQNKANEEMQQ